MASIGLFILLIFILLHENQAKYYYKDVDGTYDVYYGPAASWGYKEFKPPKSFKIDFDDRGDRPGKCYNGDFTCHEPYLIKETEVFECTVDYQCPRYFKCCQPKCFQHKICQPISVPEDEGDSGITTNTIPVSKPSTSSIFTTKSVTSTTTKTTPTVTTTTTPTTTSTTHYSTKTTDSTKFVSTVPTVKTTTSTAKHSTTTTASTKFTSTAKPTTTLTSNTFSTSTAKSSTDITKFTSTTEPTTISTAEPLTKITNTTIIPTTASSTRKPITSTTESTEFISASTKPFSKETQIPTKTTLVTSITTIPTVLTIKTVATSTAGTSSSVITKEPSQIIKSSTTSTSHPSTTTSKTTPVSTESSSTSTKLQSEPHASTIKSSTYSISEPLTTTAPTLELSRSTSQISLPTTKNSITVPTSKPPLTVSSTLQSLEQRTTMADITTDDEDMTFSGDDELVTNDVSTTPESETVKLISVSILSTIGDMKFTTALTANTPFETTSKSVGDAKETTVLTTQNMSPTTQILESVKSTESTTRVASALSSENSTGVVIDTSDDEDLTFSGVYNSDTTTEYIKATTTLTTKSSSETIELSNPVPLITSSSSIPITQLSSTTLPSKLVEDAKEAAVLITENASTSDIAVTLSSGKNAETVVDTSDDEDLTFSGDHETDITISTSKTTANIKFTTTPTTKYSIETTIPSKAVSSVTSTSSVSTTKLSSTTLPSNPIENTKKATVLTTVSTTEKLESVKPSESVPSIGSTLSSDTSDDDDLTFSGDYEPDPSRATDDLSKGSTKSVTNEKSSTLAVKSLESTARDNESSNENNILNITITGMTTKTNTLSTTLDNSMLVTDKEFPYETITTGKREPSFSGDGSNSDDEDIVYSGDGINEFTSTSSTVTEPKGSKYPTTFLTSKETEVRPVLPGESDKYLTDTSTDILKTENKETTTVTAHLTTKSGLESLKSSESYTETNKTDISSTTVIYGSVITSATNREAETISKEITVPPAKEDTKFTVSKINSLTTPTHLPKTTVSSTVVDHESITITSTKANIGTSGSMSYANNVFVINSLLGTLRKLPGAIEEGSSDNMDPYFNTFLKVFGNVPLIIKKAYTNDTDYFNADAHLNNTGYTDEESSLDIGNNFLKINDQSSDHINDEPEKPKEGVYYTETSKLSTSSPLNQLLSEVAKRDNLTKTVNLDYNKENNDNVAPNYSLKSSASNEIKREGSNNYAKAKDKLIAEEVQGSTNYKSNSKNVRNQEYIASAVSDESTGEFDIPVLEII